MKSFEGYLKEKLGNDYVLLADGSHKALSDFSMSGHSHSYLPLTGGTMSGTIFNIGGVGGNVGGRNSIGTSTGTNLDFIIGHGGEDYAEARMLLYDQRYIHLHPKVRIGSYSTSTTPSYTLEVDGTLNASSIITQNGTAVSLEGHTHSYLPLTGGKLSLSTIKSLTIYKNSNASGFIYFTYNKNNIETPMGYLGVQGVNNPAFETADEQHIYTLLHQNNWSTYITKVAASGIADYLTTVLVSNITACSSVDKTGVYSSSGFSDRPSGVSNWGTLVNLRLYSNSNAYARQLFFDCYATNKIWARYNNDNTWGDWVRLILETDLPTATVGYAKAFPTILTVTNDTPTVDLSSNALNSGGLARNYSDSSKWVNGPSGLKYGTCLTISSGGGKSLSGQLLWDINHNDANNNVTNNLYFRAADSSGWRNDWKRIVFASELGAYLPLSGGNLTGSLTLTNSNATSNYRYIRMERGASASDMHLLEFTISAEKGQLIYNHLVNGIANKSGVLSIKDTLAFNDNVVYHAGNSNKSDVSWEAANLTANNYLLFNAYPGYGTGSCSIYYNASSTTIRTNNATDLNLSGNKVWHAGNFIPGNYQLKSDTSGFTITNSSWVNPIAIYRTGVGSGTLGGIDGEGMYFLLIPLGGSPSYMYLKGGKGLTVSASVYAVNFYTTSDRSKKQNISSFSEHIRKFQLKDTEKWHYGVIALEVPEMFRDGEEGSMTVNYNSVLSYYIGILENKVNQLELKIKYLENK